MENAGIENKDLIAGAAAPEGVSNETSELTEENLFEKVDSGEITMEEANEFIRRLESEADGNVSAGSVDSTVGNETPSADVTESVSVPEENFDVSPDYAGGDEDKPFKVYQTQEDFQRDFDRSWNKRYAKEKAEREAKEREHNELLKSLGAMFGVEPSEAANELYRRQMQYEAQKAGKDPDEYIERQELISERDRYKAQAEENERARQGMKFVSDVRAQGAEIAMRDASFNIDAAMADPDFKNTVCSLYGAFPDKAVEMAYKSVYKGVKTQPARVSPDVAARPSEGAAVARTAGEKKAEDYSKMSSAQIRELEKRILSGQKI